MVGSVEAHTGVRFDLRGLVMLGSSGGEGWSPARRSKEVRGIPVNQQVNRLHILHGVEATAPMESQIGAYVMHYADGRSQEFPIVYGRDVLGPSDGHLAQFRATVAWAGQPTNSIACPLLRFCKATWANPRPEVEVSSLDFISHVTNCPLFLAAITLEETGAQHLPYLSPPIELINMTNTIWFYNQNGVDQGRAWKNPDFIPDPAQGWQKGRGLFAGNDNVSYGYPFHTAWPQARGPFAADTHYAFTRFKWSTPTDGLVLYGTLCIDDGVVIYINGQEVYRFNMPPGPVTFGYDGKGTYTSSAKPGGEPVIVPFWMPGANVVVGENLIAAEVHQSGHTSTDVVFGLDLWGYRNGPQKLDQ